VGSKACVEWKGWRGANVVNALFVCSEFFVFGSKSGPVCFGSQSGRGCLAAGSIGSHDVPSKGFGRE
jgi:hypothetical protein